MMQWAQISFLLKDVVQLLKIIVIISAPVAAVIAVGLLILMKRAKRS